MWPFLSYGQCPVPSCPDKGSLSVLNSIRVRGVLLITFGGLIESSRLSKNEIYIESNC